MKKRIWIADPIAEEGVAELSATEGLEIDYAPNLSPEEQRERIKGRHGVIVRSTTRIEGELLEAGEALEVIGRAGIGVDNIDVPAASLRGIVVLNTPDANATTTAELAVAHMFSLARRLPAADRSVRAGEWRREALIGTELVGKTVGVVGFGTIGRIFASRCQGIGMKVLAFDPFVTPETFATRGILGLGLDELLAEADFVSLHCTLNPETRGMINAERLAKMKMGARLINCARGALIDEAALIAALQSGHLAGAALDVYSKEPPGADHPLLALENCVFTPHLGASTVEAQIAVGVEIARQVRAYLLHGEAIHAVNLPHRTPAEVHAEQPYMDLALRLGVLLSALSEVIAPCREFSVSLEGECAKLDSRPVAHSALSGFLRAQSAIPINLVNALPVARRQGISLVESRSGDVQDFLSLLRIKAISAKGEYIVAGTLFDGRHPRLIRVQNCPIEASLSGDLLLSLHEDRPGVVGAIGSLLGRAGINIKRMQIGNFPLSGKALGVFEIDVPVSEEHMRALLAQNGIERIIQVRL